MKTQAFASIDLAEKTLRYAEVEHRSDDVHPLRLGSCDFEFDVAHAMLGAEASLHLDVVTEALADVWDGATAAPLRVVVHPPDAYAFVTVVPATLSADERALRFRQEAALLVGPEPDAPPHVTTFPVGAETHLDIEPVQVVAVPDAVRARFEQMLDALVQTRVQFVLSTQAAARVMARNAAASAAPAASFELAVGVYPSHIEYALLHDGGWYYSHYVEAEDPVDAAYFAAVLLDRLEIPRAAVGQVGFYGLGADEAALAPFETVFEVSPAFLDPFGILNIDREAVHSDFGAGAYVPCVGGAL